MQSIMEEWKKKGSKEIIGSLNWIEQPDEYNFTTKIKIKIYFSVDSVYL